MYDLLLPNNKFTDAIVHTSLEEKVKCKKEIISEYRKV